MHVDRYISELLYDFECVVLPGLGGFIASDRPATVNTINHQFTPPFRKLTFNKYLKTNDGLLTDHIARSEELPYEEAGKIVEQFVETCLKDLQNNQVVVFENIGRLHYDNRQHLVFEQDTSVNYHPEAFGLNEFVSPVIKRTTDEEKIKGVILPERKEHAERTDRKGERALVKKRNRRIVVTAFAVFVLLFTTGLGVVKQNEIKSYWENQASFFQFITSISSKDHSGADDAVLTPRNSINDEMTRKHGIKTGNPVALINNNESVTKKEKPVPEPNTKETKSSDNPSSSAVADHTKNVVPVNSSAKVYYIIAGSFSKKANAEKLVKNLRMQGFDAMMAGTNKNGLFRVAYMTVKGRKEAGKKLYTIRSEENADAWILRKPI
ncbi:MAG: SPOR domain-containing protein [Chlorobi bacterium]|nr:SPOR domain-containing protein [Chlorobiota bacterium]